MDSETRVGNYVIEKLIGRGGMGVVYRGRHATLPRVVAVKSINSRGSQDLRRMRQRFEREAFIQSQLDHPSIVKIYDYIVAEQTYFIIMEYVEGLSLAQLIEREHGRLGVGRALDLFERILEAVVYAHTFVYRDEQGAAHRGIVHRDLKPPNILVTPDDRIKITDFGIVKLVGGETSDTSGLAYGSPRYVSPEQARGETVDQRSDIYSLGIILYEMLTGQTPYSGKTKDDAPRTRTSILRAHIEETPRPLSEMNLEVTPEVEAVVLRALEKKPERRFATAADFYRALRQAHGLDAAEMVETSPLDASPADADDTGESTRVTGDFARDSYHTQPIKTGNCEGCGAEAGADERACGACGKDFVASPATAGLTRREGTARGKSRRRLVGALITLLALSVPVLYLIFRDKNVVPGVEHESRDAAAPVALSPTASSSTGKPANAATPVELAARVGVDSSYEGYSAAPLNDGVTNVRRVAALKYNKGNWVSAENLEPHWIELSFERPARVTALYLYWGFDRDRFMPSRRVELQVPDGDGGAWRTVSQLEAGGNYDRAAFEFEPLTTSKLRILQPAQAGPSNRPFLMWMREVQAFGNVEEGGAAR